MGKSTISMAIFNSYVKLPEGRTILLSDLQFIKALPHIGDIPTYRAYRSSLFQQVPGSGRPNMFFFIHWIGLRENRKPMVFTIKYRALPSNNPWFLRFLPSNLMGLPVKKIPSSNSMRIPGSQIKISSAPIQQLRKLVKLESRDPPKYRRNGWFVYFVY